MNATTFKKPLAIVLLAALAACSGRASTSPIPEAPGTQAQGVHRNALHAHRYSLGSIVGVGDSLTAGYQSGGFLGAYGVPNPLNSFPGFNIVPPGQESGFWADLYEQATGFPPHSMYNPAISPLPLVHGPGLDNQVVSSSSTVLGTLKTGNPCTAYNGFNQDGFELNKLNVVRMNPNSPYIRDIGVPGITLHEALYMTAPIAFTCESIPGVPGLLSAVVNGESGIFYPVLGGFVNQGVPASKLTEANVAASLRPQLVTVWLGANDVLKYMGSGGLFTGGDQTPGQAENDVLNVIHRVSGATGAQVAVANLPDVLLTPYFMNAQIPPNAKACTIRQYFYCLLTTFGVSATDAAKVTTVVARTYGLIPPGGKCVPGSTSAPCGYLTLQGALTIIPVLVSTGKIPSLDPSGPGSGLGNHYITPGFAAKIQTVNNNVNEGIDLAAQQSGAAFVDVKTIFEGIASGDPKNPYFRLAQVNPGTCCTLAFLGGLVSYDGLHPSNTGYALIAYAFIASINQKYNAGIPEVPIDKIYKGAPPYRFPDPYAPQFAGDLKIIPYQHVHAIR